MKPNKRSFRGGGGKSAKPQYLMPYDPTQDPGYKKSADLLASLGPQFDKAVKRMTPEEIMKSLPALSQAIIESQKTAPVAAKGANWGALNQYTPDKQPGAIKPIFAPQPPQGSMFNGPQSINTALLSTPGQNYTYLASLLGQSPASLAANSNKGPAISGKGK